MLTELIELLKKLESDIGNGVLVRVCLAVEEDALEFRLDWRDDFHMKFKIKNHERTSKACEAMVIEAKRQHGQYSFERQQGVNHTNLAKLQREYKGPPPSGG